MTRMYRKSYPFSSRVVTLKSSCTVVSVSTIKIQSLLVLQGLFVPFARVGSCDRVRVLRLLHNEYTRYN